MGISRYTLYKYVKVDGDWRYCKAAYYDNAKIKPDIVFVNAKEGLVEKHPEGRYYMSHNAGWIDASSDALEAQRKRKQRLALDEFHRLSGKSSAQSSIALPDDSGQITLSAAAEKYFENCEARGLDPETIRKYRAAVDPFVEHCGVTYVAECRDNKQVLLNYMGWLRKQPVPKRKHSNPERTLANRVGDVRISSRNSASPSCSRRTRNANITTRKLSPTLTTNWTCSMAPPTPTKSSCSTSLSAAWRETMKPLGSTAILI
jgi:hypothetical protein